MQRDFSSSTLDSYFSSASSPPPYSTSPPRAGFVKQELSIDTGSGGGEGLGNSHGSSDSLKLSTSPARSRKRRSTPPPTSAASSGAGAAQQQQQSAAAKTSPTTTKASSAAGAAAGQHKRIVCDHCRRRRIRCDGNIPCQQCIHATLTCKRDHVPKKRGPKRGHGRVIDELRESDKQTSGPASSGSFTSQGGGQGQPFYLGQPSYLGPGAIGLQDVDYYDGSLYFDSSAPTSGAPTGPSSPTAEIASYFPPPAVPVPQITPPIPPPFMPGFDLGGAPAALRRTSSEPTSPYTTDAFRPNSRDYTHLIPRCLDLYYDHIYPIMPILYMPAVRTIISRPMSAPEKNLIYAMSALTSFHMSGKSLAVPGAPNWELAGKFFLDECISVRQEYDFLEDASLSAVISSFWLSTSFFEINQNRKSWYYLREALTLAMDMGLDDDKTYHGLSPEETLCRRRVFWILYVTERSFAILRNKPLTLRKTPSLPAHGHAYESRDIHTGFLKLVRSYIPLDESFVNAWNDGSDPQVSATTYLNLQQLLAHPLDFLLRPSRRRSSAISRRTATASMGSNSPDGSMDSTEEPEPTDIQKADLLMTQQWLRLIVWQSSFRQGLLSTAPADESMTFSYPLSIAKDTAAILQSLPSHAVEVHGMGIMEKIFEIGTWCVNVLNAYESGPKSPGVPFGGGAAEGGIAGMDYVGGGDMGVLVAGHRGGRWAPTIDPLEFFVKTLSSSPNSRTMFAEKLLMLVEQSPGAMRASLSPTIPFNGITDPAAFGLGSLPAAFAGTSIGGSMPQHRNTAEAVDNAVVELEDDSLPTMSSMLTGAAIGMPDEMDLSPTSYSFAAAGSTGAAMGGDHLGRSSLTGNPFADNSVMNMMAGTHEDDEMLYQNTVNTEYSFSRVDPGSMGVAGLGLNMAGRDTGIRNNEETVEQDMGTKNNGRADPQQQHSGPRRSSTVDQRW
ncbi:uncharacterized protein B0I36DRAFT_435164 [Microdochium trichocladiopsis]|uniref:Zn(2)-C6 fungal-type domain-containing protein n=1 Tax=Microdochium trichocladiopsis TaxID=1682393 RepID=A0A9P8XYE7_9PEZI|nr:uncharacterized protein B0I36DRAFT_435164 [Microdochium trichocladiopsis]KAH7021315.1 hypothetical protein B0I36DRAFT_435164 [Microdochium trichocladiopsis]